MAVIKANVQEKYFVITNATARNENLSIEAKGLILIMASRPVDWNFNKTQLMNECGVGRDKLNRMFKELVNNGYLAISQNHDEQGLFKNTDYYFFADPELNPAFIPLTEKPLTDNPCNGESAPTKERVSTKERDLQNEQKELLELGFENFYSNWHNKKGKGKAKIAFTKVSMPYLKESEYSFKRFVEKITTYAVDRMRHIETQKELNTFYFDDGFPNLHPTTYLNNARWEDEYK